LELGDGDGVVGELVPWSFGATDVTARHRDRLRQLDLEVAAVASALVFALMPSRVTPIISAKTWFPNVVACLERGA
jgi:hypothetical protein